MIYDMYVYRGRLFQIHELQPTTSVHNYNEENSSTGIGTGIRVDGPRSPSWPKYSTRVYSVRVLFLERLNVHTVTTN